ncbi:MAG: glutamine amidotransferase, partial [Syntrophomonadaceae bacterium]|nr:glutamine amidotransferase [Syntrophomonadaceae bacterium]
DQLLLQDLAQWGQGRYYFSEDAYNIPRIFTKETMKAIKSYLVEESFYPKLNFNSPVMAGILQMPVLNGYVATTPKQTAQLVLSSSHGDPVLAHWQYGLGRSIAFTSDAGGRWAGSWVSWADYNRFWGNLLSWTLPRHSENNGLQLNSSLKGTQGLIALESSEFSVSRQSDGVVVDPELDRQEIKLEAVAPGRYEGAFTARHPGVYFLNVSQQGTDGELKTASGGLAISYSPEYNYAGTDYNYLQQLAKAGGGSILGDPKEAFADNLYPVKAVFDLWPWLLIIAVLVLPLDIAARRLNILPSDLKKGLMIIHNKFKKLPLPEEAPATLNRLREKKSMLKDLQQDNKIKQETYNNAQANLPNQAEFKSKDEERKAAASELEDKLNSQQEKPVSDSSAAPSEERMSRLLQAKKRAKK